MLKQKNTLRTKEMTCTKLLNSLKQNLVCGKLKQRKNLLKPRKKKLKLDLSKIKLDFSKLLFDFSYTAQLLFCLTLQSPLQCIFSLPSL